MFSRAERNAGTGCGIGGPYTAWLEIADGLQMQFEWDPDKAERNERKHGISFLEACTVFNDDYASTVLDPHHSEADIRYLTFGMSSSGTPLVVAHTDRRANIRIISARPMTPRERRAYEQ